MCIAIASIEHPEYPFVLLSNRDEYFKRPTMSAHIRNVGEGIKVLSPLDLERPEHGSWIGVTNKGRIAVLLNYRELANTNIISEVSRGILPIEYLGSRYHDDDTWLGDLKEKLVKELGEDAEQEEGILSHIGGFSLLYGRLEFDEAGKLKPLNILSNRGDRAKILNYNCHNKNDDNDITTEPTFGISNSLYSEPWPKVKLSVENLKEVIEESIIKEYSQETFVERCFDILSRNTYSDDLRENGTNYDKFVELKNSVFIPSLNLSSIPECVEKRDASAYGTRTQTVILLTKQGELHYYERQTNQNIELGQNLDMGIHHFKFKISE